MKVFTPEQMRAFDAAATNEYSIPSFVLMENAALRVVEFLEWKFAPLRGKRVAVLCGKGNNGGDGFAIARHLTGLCFVDVFLACSPHELKGDALINYRALQHAQTHGEVFLNMKVIAANEDNYKDTSQFLDYSGDADIILDALLGTGFHSGITDARMRCAMQYASAEWKPCVAIDLPSGLNAQTGQAAPETIRVDYTVTFASPKSGMLLRDGIDLCGEIWVGGIGTASEQLPDTKTGCELLSRTTAHALLPYRPTDAHKGTAGRVIICGGSRGMSGAPALASRAALRVGAGLCIACVPDRVLDSFSTNILEATSHALPCDDEGRLIESAADKLPDIWQGANVVALGPGLSRSDGALNFARRIVRECDLPLIIDADALYALPAIADQVKARMAPTILTPHPGEMGELMGSDAKSVNEQRLEIAVECAQKYNAFVVLKGARSVVAAPDGRTWINLTGNAGMATGGSGDVLTGTIAGLLAQLKDALNATLLGVYLHGLAGDIEYSKTGNGLVAHDIADALPHAILDLQNRPEAQSINARLKKLE